MVQLNFTTSKHGCHQQFLKHGQKFSFLLIWIMCFWFRKNSQGFLQQHRWQVMKSDGSCYNTMTSMHVDRRENLNGFPPTGFSVFLWFRHINKPFAVSLILQIFVWWENLSPCSSPVVCTFVVKGVAEFDRLQSAKMTPSRSSSTDGYISPQHYRVFWGF